MKVRVSWLKGKQYQHIKEFKYNGEEMMESAKVHKCVSTDEKFLDWKILYQNMERLLRKEMCHYDGSIVTEHPAFMRAKQLFTLADQSITFESGVRHIAAANILYISIQSDKTLIEQRL